MIILIGAVVGLVVLVLLIRTAKRGLRGTASGVNAVTERLRAATNSPDAAPGQWKPRRYSTRTQVIAGLVLGLAVAAVMILVLESL